MVLGTMWGAVYRDVGAHSVTGAFVWAYAHADAAVEATARPGAYAREPALVCNEASAFAPIPAWAQLLCEIAFGSHAGTCTEAVVATSPND